MIDPLGTLAALRQAALARHIDDLRRTSTR
jgi:hypothetical protein